MFYRVCIGCVCDLLPFGVIKNNNNNNSSSERASLFYRTRSERAFESKNKERVRFVGSLINYRINNGIDI